MERRVLREPRRSVRDIDLQPPRQRRRPSEELLVEVVAPAADRLREHDAGRDRVHEHERVEFAPAREHDHRDEPAADRAPDRESALPDLERADDPARAPAVPREQVVHACADDARDHDGTDDRADFLRVVPGARPAVSAILAATSTPIASIRPYACSGRGPMCTIPCFGLGMNATVTARCYDGSSRRRQAADAVCDDGRTRCSPGSRRSPVRWRRVHAAGAVCRRPAVRRPAAPAARRATTGPSLGGCPMFPANNPWNQNVDARSRCAPTRRTLIANISSPGKTKLHPDFGGGGAYGIPFMVVPATQPQGADRLHRVRRRE